MMTRLQAFKHFAVASGAGFPIFWVVAYWGRTPRLGLFAAGFAVLWGGISVWMRAATILRDRDTMLTPGHRN